MAQGPATAAGGVGLAARDVFRIVGATLLDRFKVESLVGEGDFGVVYRAHDGAPNAPVALKCLKVPEAMTGESRALLLETFRSEGACVSSLATQIPEVVRPVCHEILALPDAAAVPIIALEWLEGEAFDRILTRRRVANRPPIGVRELVLALRPVAVALARAHRFVGTDGRVAAVHGDIRPERIHFVAHGPVAVKILDFGIARLRSLAGEHARDALRGAYAAPEQSQPAAFGPTGPWTDVWGLALTMVEALAGRYPFEGASRALDTSRRPTPRAAGVAVSEPIEAAFSRALAVDPRLRTQTIETFWGALEDAVGVPRAFTAHPQLVADRTSSQPSRGVWAGSSAPSPSASAHPSGRPPISRDCLARGDAELPELELGPVARQPVDRTPSCAAASPPAAAVLELAAAPAPSARPTGARVLANEPTSGASLEPATAELGRFESSDFGGRHVPHASRSEAPQSARAAESSRHTPVEAVIPMRTDDEAGLAGQLGPRFELAAVPTSRAPSTGPPRAGAVAPLSIASPRNEAVADIGQRMRLPAQLIGLAIGITLLDVAIAKLTGVSIAVGPIRSVWLTAPLALAGTGVAVWRLLGG